MGHQHKRHRRRWCLLRCLLKRVNSRKCAAFAALRCAEVRAQKNLGRKAEFRLSDGSPQKEGVHRRWSPSFCHDSFRVNSRKCVAFAALRCAEVRAQKNLGRKAEFRLSDGSPGKSLVLQDGVLFLPIFSSELPQMRSICMFGARWSKRIVVILLSNGRKTCRRKENF